MIEFTVCALHNWWGGMVHDEIMIAICTQLYNLHLTHCRGLQIQSIRVESNEGVKFNVYNTYRRLWIIGVKISSRLDDLLCNKLLLDWLLLSLVRDELTAFLLGFSMLDKPDNPSLLCHIYFDRTSVKKWWWRWKQGRKNSFLYKKKLKLDTDGRRMDDYIERV